MKTTLLSKVGLLLVAIAVVVITVVANWIFRGYRLDLTENSIYTLSPGTDQMLKGLSKTVSLTLYFSRRQSEGIPQLRNYAQQVEELLKEYVQLSAGKVELTIVDPEPFSEAEDQATALGLQAVPLSQDGIKIYLGLVAESSVSGHSSGPNPPPDADGDGTREMETKTEIISFLSPEKERLLEYDVSNLIYTVSRTYKPQLGLISTLPVFEGGFDMATHQVQPPWMSLEQLRKLYEIKELGNDISAIPEDIALLVLILPELTPQTEYAIDQYLLGGGHALIFLDPYAEVGSGSQMMGEQDSVRSAYLVSLLSAWGLEMVADRFVADEQNALVIGGRGGHPVRHLGIGGYGADNFNRGDVVTSNLKTVNIASAGALRWQDGLQQPDVVLEPLLLSSKNSALMETSRLHMLMDPRMLYRDFRATGEQYILMARVAGTLKTAFPDGRPEPEKKSDEANPEKNKLTAKAATGEQSKQDQDKTQSDQQLATRPHMSQSEKPANIIIVTDTDLLSDRLWVQVTRFFGQQIANPFANNGDLVVNMVDNLTGNADLIGMRSRSEFSRPFTRVDELERLAQARFLKKEEELNRQLQETENRLLQLQMKKQGQDTLVLSDEQAEEVKRFQQEKVKIRKQLREVQLRLNQDIESLGSRLKLANISLVPVTLTILGLVWRQYGRRARRKSRLEQHGTHDRAGR